MKVFYYIKSYIYNALPTFYFKRKYKWLKSYEKECNQQEINSRLNYYFKSTEEFDIPGNAVAVKDFKKSGGTNYYLDLKEFLHYFKPNARFCYQFGDDTHVNDYPTLFKARPVGDDNTNSILFKLNKVRHFRWFNDPYKYSEKKDFLVWRGAAYKELRRDFVKKFWNNPLCNIGQTNSPAEDVPWQKDFLSVKEQFKYKIILSLEGNDVATNLKWIMASNSLCFMPKPRFETWYMEGSLQAGVHYIEVNPPYNDLEEKIRYYTEHIEEAEKIIYNAKAYVKQFMDNDKEDLLCLKVLEKYALLSGQKDELKFLY